MKDVEDRYRSYLDSIDINQQLFSILLASMVSKKMIPIVESFTVEYWVKQVTTPVLFSNSFGKVFIFGIYGYSSTAV